jgi:hypothetical protein
MAGTVSAILKEALSHVGYHEGRAKNGTWNNINKFGAWYAAQIKNPAFNGVPWCDIFISYVASVTGSGDIIPLSAYVPSRLNYYRARKLTGYFPPRPGDIGFVLSKGRAVHVFLVVAWDAKNSQVITVEGNTNTTGSPQGDGVYSLRRKDYNENPNLIYARPTYAPEPKPTPAKTAPVKDSVTVALDAIAVNLATVRKLTKK